MASCANPSPILWLLIVFVLYSRQYSPSLQVQQLPALGPVLLLQQQQQLQAAATPASVLPPFLWVISAVPVLSALPDGKESALCEFRIRALNNR